MSLKQRIKKIEEKREEEYSIEENERELTREEIKEFDCLHKKIKRDSRGYSSFKELTDEEWHRYNFLKRWRHGRNIKGIWHDGQKERLKELGKFRWHNRVGSWSNFFNIRLLLSIFYRIDIIWLSWGSIEPEKYMELYNFTVYRKYGLQSLLFHLRVMSTVFYIHTPITRRRQ